MLCADPFLTMLKSIGYCAIRLPRPDVRPLQVMTRRRKDLDRLGELTDLLVPGKGVLPPEVSGNQPAPKVSGQRTGELSVGVGLSVLGTVLGAMGGSKLGLEAQYRAAKTVTFEFGDVQENHVELIKLDQYLNAADVNPASRYTADLLESDDVYVITSTIKSRTISVEAVDSRGASIGVDVPAIQGIVGANVQIGGKDGGKSSVTYEGAVPLVFGFQAVRLYYNRGQYSAFRPLEPEQGALREIQVDTSEPGTRGVEVATTTSELLDAEGPFLRIDLG